jgi:MinD-like ATPase involved in chromosome partitioning or flagellar assembly
VTTNNDTPQISGEDTSDEWAAWADRVEPVAPQEDYPQPSFHPFEPVDEPGTGPADPSLEEQDYPRVPGYVPGPRDHGGPRAPGYPQTPGYAPEAGYTPNLGYLGEPAGHEPHYQPEAGHGRGAEYEPETGHAGDAGYAGDQGYLKAAEPEYPRTSERGYPDLHYRADGNYGDEAADPGFGAGPRFAASALPVPPMESLPETGLAGTHGRGAAPALTPLPIRTPPAGRAAEDWVYEDRPSGAWVSGGVVAQGQAPGNWASEGQASDGWTDDGGTGEGWAGQGWVAQPEPFPEREDVRETSDSLTTESLLHGKRSAPGSGWRRNVFRATGGLLRLGESAAEMRRRDLINRVRTPVAGGHHRVAVLSLKGGVGKTTTAVGLGATLATLRGDRVIAVDANPDRGTLSDKVRLETAATVRDLLNERGQIRRYADVRAFTSQASSRLEVLASDRDPGVSVAFGADDYCDAARVLESFYSICITDCGTGLLHSAMAGVLQLADQIVLVSSPSVDGARSASATLDWLEAHNCGDLVRNGVVVLSAIRPKSKSTVDLDRLEHHFASRCRAVARIPYDPHLEEGAEVELELLHDNTADAYLGLAAPVGDGLAWPRRLTACSALP